MNAESRNPLIERAVKALGGRQSDLARAMGCAQQTVSKLLNGEIRCSAEQAIAIERATGAQVGKAELRPDLFGDSPPTAPDRPHPGGGSPATPPPTPAAAKVAAP